MKTATLTLKLYTQEAVTLCQIKTVKRQQYLLRLASRSLHFLYRKSTAFDVYAIVALHEITNHITAVDQQFDDWQQQLNRRIARRIGTLPAIALPMQSRIQFSLHTPLQYRLYALCKRYDTYVANLHRARLACGFAHQNAYYLGKDKARAAITRLWSRLAYLKKESTIVTLNDYLNDTPVYRKSRAMRPALVADNVYLALLSPVTPLLPDALMRECKARLQLCQEREKNESEQTNQEETQ